MNIIERDRQFGYKKIADDIRQILSKVKETPERSYRRWIWELMQNAKDVKDPNFDTISVKISYDENELTFSHNGLPFEINDILGIVKQTSSKSSSNNDKSVTGKFGTGFIVTHLLSDIINIKGYVHDGNETYYKLNNLQLDRSGQSSEELMPKIEDAHKYILKLETNPEIFPIEHNYKQRKTKNNFDTSFNYKLNTPRNKKAAIEGVADLKNTLPVTLVFVSEIGEVIIENKNQSTINHYKVFPVSEVGKIKLVRVDLNGNVSRYFLKFTDENFSLVTEVSDFNSYTLIDKSDKAPTLFRDFPLIGSEKFHFPFYLNGFEFNPTEERNDIVLVNEDSAEVLSNRSIIEQAVDGVLEFTEFLIEKNATNRFVCALSRIPELTVPLQEDVKGWLSELQINWRDELIEYELVRTADGKYIPLRECWIPNDNNTNKFYSIASKFLGEDVVPSEDLNLAWIEKTKPKSELDSWNESIWYDLDNLLSSLEKLENINNLSEKIENPIEWLNDLYTYIDEKKVTELFDEYSVIPNQIGDFCFLEDLCLEDPSSRIPDSFLDILEDLGKSWRKDLIHRDINNINKNIERLGLGDVSKEVNEIIGSKKWNARKRTQEYTFLENGNALKILVQIIKHVSNEESSNFQTKIFKVAKDLIHFEESLYANSVTNDFQFTVAIKLLIKIINKKISECDDMNGLATCLGLDAADTVFWLDDYLNLIMNSETYKSEIKRYDIIPNRYGNFCAFDKIYAFGTDDLPLDSQLIDILWELNDNNNKYVLNWKHHLLYDGITIKLEARKFAELGDKIDNTLKELVTEDSENPGSLDSFKQQIYQLLDWCNNHEELAQRYLKYTIGKSNELWVRFSMTAEIMSVLRDDESLDIVSKISRSTVSKKDINELLDVINEIGSTEELLKQAITIRDDKKNMEFLLSVGKRIENVIKDSIDSELIDSELIDNKSIRDGIGAYDLTFKNVNNGKAYHVEVKSYAESSYDDFRFAPSQAEKAMRNEPNYAIAFLKRPGDELVTNEYIQSNLKYCKYTSEFMKGGYNDYSQFKAIKNRQDEISSLRAVLREPLRIQVSKNVLLDNSNGFDGLIHDIKSFLM